MFLLIARGNSYRTVSEWLQHSAETVNRFFHPVLNALADCLHPEVVRLPKGNAPTPEEISKDYRFAGYFDDCIGAGDGTHIQVRVSTDIAARFRSRKGHISQNIFATCSFNFLFTYNLPGWEGSAHDMRVMNDALSKGFHIPEGRFYLLDASFSLRKGSLTPYRGVRYHLREQALASLRPENKEELFNL